MSSLLTAKLEVDDYHPQLKTGRAALAIIGVLWSSLQSYFSSARLSCHLPILGWLG